MMKISKLITQVTGFVPELIERASAVELDSDVPLEPWQLQQVQSTSPLPLTEWDKI